MNDFWEHQCPARSPATAQHARLLGIDNSWQTGCESMGRVLTLYIRRIIYMVRRRTTLSFRSSQSAFFSFAAFPSVRHPHFIRTIRGQNRNLSRRRIVNCFTSYLQQAQIIYTGPAIRKSTNYILPNSSSSNSEHSVLQYIRAPSARISTTPVPRAHSVRSQIL